MIEDPRMNKFIKITQQLKKGFCHIDYLAYHAGSRQYYPQSDKF